MADIVHRVGIKAPIGKVYAALSTIEGLSGWWTKDTVGQSVVGKLVVFRFQNPKGETIGEMGMEVAALEPGKKVAWKCKSGPKEWIGTDLTFHLSEADGLTIVLFAHRHWPEAEEFMSHCSTKWAIFLMSLKELAETGKGKPSPVDVKIDNWN